MSTTSPVALVLMGVSGCGKTTVAATLAHRLGWPFCEGDDLHPASNVAKMASGHPLTDADRRPWLTRIRDWIDSELAADRSGIVACSALKRSYRDVLRGPDVVFVHLSGSKELIAERLSHRHGHYMPGSLLESQFADLEAPVSDERALTIDISVPVPAQVEEIVASLELEPADA